MQFREKDIYIEKAGASILDYLEKHGGSVTKTEGKYHGEGGLTVKKTEYGIVPVEGKIYADVKNADLEISLETGEVNISCSTRDAAVAEELASKIRQTAASEQEPSQIRIVRRYNNVGPVIGRLFTLIKKKGKLLDIQSSGFNTRGPPDFVYSVDGLVLAEGKVRAEIDSVPYMFDVSHNYNIIAIYCDPEKQESVKVIFDALEPEKALSTGKVVSTLYGEFELDNFSWRDVGGLKNIKESLIQNIEWPLKNPDAFKKVKAEQPRGILLYGPPGTGKTLIARVLACESKASFISTNAKELTSMWYGQEEKRIGELFKKAREKAPSIIFMDEIDCMTPARDPNVHEVTRRALLTFCQEMDGIEKLSKVVVLGATNRPQDIDPALLRPGRFDLLVEVPAPDTAAREEIFRVHTTEMPLVDIDLGELSKQTEGFTGADIKEICRSAGLSAINRYITQHGIDIKDVIGERINELCIGRGDFVLQKKEKAKIVEGYS